MKSIIVILLFFILLAVCWPLALVMIVLLPLLWLILLPFQIIGLTIGLIFKLVSAVLLFPFKLVGAA